MAVHQMMPKSQILDQRRKMDLHHRQVVDVLVVLVVGVQVVAAIEQLPQQLLVK